MSFSHAVFQGYNRHGEDNEDVIATPETVQSQNG